MHLGGERHCESKVRVKCLAQEPGPLAPESSTLTIRPPRLPEHREAPDKSHNIVTALVGETWMFARGSIKSVVKEISKPKGRREPTKDFFYFTMRQTLASYIDPLWASHAIFLSWENLGQSWTKIVSRTLQEG